MSFTAATAHLYEEQKFIRELTSYMLVLSEKKLLPDETYRDMSTALLTRTHQITTEIEINNKLNK